MVKEIAFVWMVAAFLWLGLYIITPVGFTYIAHIVAITVGIAGTVKNVMKNQKK